MSMKDNRPYYRRTMDMQWLTAEPRLAPDAYVPSAYYIVEYDGFDKVDTANWTLIHRSEVVNTALYRDDRFRTPPPRLYHEVRMDMEAAGIKGASTLQHHRGQRSMRLDPTTREMEPFTWTVTENMATGSVVLSGSAEVLQEDDGNFIALILTVHRDGREIACYYAPYSEQNTTFGQWDHVGVILRPSVPLLKGDVVRLRAAALSMKSAMYLDDVELRILH